MGCEEMRNKSRKQPLVRARQAFCMVARKLTDAPLTAVGGMIGRDHTTVMHSVSKAEIIAESDAAFGDRITKIFERFDF
jgi:chromosomal replication initiator protein